MSTPSEILGRVHSQPPPDTTLANPSTTQYTEFLIIMAALICALFSVLGLASIARCAWNRHSSSDSLSPPTNKGLKKKYIRALPKTTFNTTESSLEFSECPICLGEFCASEEIRVLPLCGHAFHVSCVDTWLRSHSTCPSCRRVLVVPLSSSGEASENAEAMLKIREDQLSRHVA